MKDLSLTASSSTETLSNLFNRFVESSNQLQAAYDELRVETDQLRKRLNQKDQEIAQATKMATLGQAAAALAHEIRNPLGAIKLFAALLKDELTGSAQGLNFLNHIEISISQLDATISNILQFSKQAECNLSPLNLSALLRERISSFRLSHPGLKISEQISAEDLYILGVEQSLRQIINNLLINSAQATKGLGQVDILLSKLPNADIQLQIKDSGPGIPEQVLSSIFEPFVTTKNEGVGLGLSIVKRLIDQHQARIEASNSNGAIFNITFPANQSSDKRLAA